MKKRTWSEAQLKKAVGISTSLRQVLAKLNLREAGGNYEQIKKYLSEYGISTGHFRGKAWNKGLKFNGRYRIPLEKVLVRNSSY